MNIDGRTVLYALAGQNIGFSPIPEYFNKVSGYMGYNSVLLPFDTQDDIHMVMEALRILNFKGVYIDTPHRCSINEFLLSRSEEARQCGAVNVIRLDDNGLYGHNTEIAAFRKAFPMITGEQINGRKIFLIGGGGIARAIAAACVLEQCDSLTVVNRTPEKSKIICQAAGMEPNKAIPADINDVGTIHNFYNAEIIINATSVGMFPHINAHPLPKGYNVLPHHIVFDTVYHPPQTNLLQTSEEKGCRIFNGRDIMFFSCLEAFQWWTDVLVDPDSEKKLFHIWKEMIYNI